MLFNKALKFCEDQWSNSNSEKSIENHGAPPKFISCIPLLFIFKIRQLFFLYKCINFFGSVKEITVRIQRTTVAMLITLETAIRLEFLNTVWHNVK